MKKILFSVMLVVFTISYAQVGINTTTPSSAAVLHLEALNSATGSYGGFMPPVVNLAQRALIPVSAVDDGLMIYLVEGTQRCVQVYNAITATWVNMYCMPLPVSFMYQDFETTPNTPEMTYTGTGAFASGNGAYPNSPMYSEGSRGYKGSNGTKTVSFNPIDTSGNSSVSISFDLASFSTTSGNGADGADFVDVRVSTDGTSWSSEVKVNGNSNARWYFAGSAVASGTYDGNNAPTTYTAPAGGNLTLADAYSKVTLTGLPISPTLYIQIRMVNNSNKEIWAIDNVILTLM